MQQVRNAHRSVKTWGPNPAKHLAGYHPDHLWKYCFGCSRLTACIIKMNFTRFLFIFSMRL